MEAYIDLTGASGKQYRYAAATDHLSPMGGNYLLMRDEGGGRGSLVYAGETENLSLGTFTRRAEGEAAHGPGLKLYVRLNVSSAVRLQEQEDIVAAYHPAMNAPARNKPSSD